MRRVKQVITVLVVLIILAVAALAIAVKTVDINKFRPQIVEALSKQTGRSIRLNGPLSLSLALDGVKLGIKDAVIGNPSWASRPDMAKIGEFDLGIAPLPLLAHQLSITEVKIQNADILLETGPGGKHNWDMPATEAPGRTSAKSAGPSGQSVSVHVNNVSIKDSQLAIRDQSGKTNIFKVSDMTLGLSGGASLHFTGDYNGAPVTADVKSSASDFMSGGSWPLTADLTYAKYHIQAKGTANPNAKKADFESYDISAGQSDIHGKLAANWRGAVPSVKGTLISDHLSPADFQPPASASGGAPAAKTESHTSSGPKRMFSDAPLPLDSLKSADANLDVTLNDVTVGNTDLKDVTGKLELNGGRLSLPVKATLGKNPMNLDIKLDAATSPAQFSMNFTAPNSDLADLLKLSGGKAFLSGTANTNMNITSSGESMHTLAGHANGTLDVIASGGQVSGDTASGISSSLAKIFAPNGTNALNCLAARFNITNGVVKDNGLLIDTTATTILGRGGANLDTETINMLLEAKTKLVNLGGVLPPLHIGGTLSNPSYSMDPAAVAKNVIGILTTGSLNTNSDVPNMEKAPAGQNACVYTLDHPVAAKSSGTPGTVSNAGKKIQNIGKSLMKGLFGK